MRMNGWGGADCWPGCLADGHFHTRSGVGHGTGPAVGCGGGGGVRPVSYCAGAHTPADLGQCAGSSVLDVCDRDAVSLVAGCLGGADPAVRGGWAAGWWSDLLSAVQFRTAEIGLPCCRFGHDRMSFGSSAHEWSSFPAEKNENFCKKPLSLWTEMV